VKQELNTVPNSHDALLTRWLYGLTSRHQLAQTAPVLGVPETRRLLFIYSQLASVASNQSRTAAWIWQPPSLIGAHDACHVL
jgi:hypothetical protein